MLRRQVSLVNVVMGLLIEDDKLRSIYLLGSIIAPDGTGEEQSVTIVGVLDEAKCNLQLWGNQTTRMFPNKPSFLDELPLP